MKIIWALIICVAISFCSCENKIATVAADTTASSIDINGVWTDSSSSSMQNAVMVLSEKDGKVVMTHYLEWKGEKFIENGVGERKGNSIVYTATVTKGIEGWATQGTHNLVVSDDGQTLSGTYNDNLDRTGPIIFKRKR